MKHILIITTFLFLFACNLYKESNSRNVKSLIEIKEVLEKENNTEDTLEYQRIREQYKDKEDSYPNLKLTDEQLKNIKEKGDFAGNKCFTCPVYTGDDPNMKYQGM